MGSFKPMIISVVIILIIVVLDIVFNNYTDLSIEEMSGKLDEIDMMLDEVDKNGEDVKSIENISEIDIEKKSKEMVDKWIEKQKFLNCYIEHNEIEKVSDKIHLIDKQIKIEDYEDARQAITEVKFSLEHLMEKQKTNIENFF